MKLLLPFDEAAFFSYLGIYHHNLKVNKIK
jgi:hypothetical protein